MEPSRRKETLPIVLPEKGLFFFRRWGLAPATWVPGIVGPDEHPMHWAGKIYGSRKSNLRVVVGYSVG